MIMPEYLIVFSILWFFKIFKSILFWLYLWQLKNYHIGRFLAHFETGFGKKIIINWFLLILLSIGFLINNVIFGFVYLLDCLYSFFILFFKKVKKPDLTKKILFLMFFIFIPFISVLFYFITNTYQTEEVIVMFLLVDILVPIFISFVVLFFQPITIFLRNRIINKAKQKRIKLENLLTIGVTGSYGKSSVKEFLRIILSESFKVTATESNNNSEMGISEHILNKVNNNHEIFICEMGAYNKGGIKLLCSIANPKIGVITGINDQHLSTFGSQENIIKAKFELVDSLPEEGLAVLNWDSELIKKNFKRDIASIKYGIKGKEDVWVENIKIDKNNVSFKVCFKNNTSVKIEADIIGEQGINNLLAAISIAKKLGMDLKEIALACKKIKQDNIFSKNRVDIINFSYSANISGVLSHLDHLKIWQGKKIIVMPCLIELGKDFNFVHKTIGERIDEVCDLAIITNKDCFKQIKKETSKAVFIDKPISVYRKIRETVSFGDVVLLEGRISNDIIKLLKQ